VLLAVAYGGIVLAQGSPAEQKEFQTKWGTAKVRHFHGTVVGHDLTCHCIFIKGARGSLCLQDDYAKFGQGYDKAKGLKVGKPAWGSYKTIDEIDWATEVHQK
jgi:hypothetical protein